MARTPERTHSDRREIDVTDREDERREPERRASTQPDLRPRDAAADRPVHVASNGSAVAALVVGMFAATYAFFAVSAIAAVIAGIVAIVLGIKGVSIANRLDGMHKGIAVTGIVSGALGLLLGIAIIAGGLTLFQNMDADDIPAELREPIEDIAN